MVQSHFSIFSQDGYGSIFTPLKPHIYVYTNIFILTVYIYVSIHIYICIYICVCGCWFFLFGISLSWTIYLLGYPILTHTHIRGVPKIGLPPIFQVMDDHDLVLNQWWLGDPPRLKVTPDILWLLELVLWLLYDYYMMIMLNPNFPISSPRSSYNNHNIS